MWAETSVEFFFQFAEEAVGGQGASGVGLSANPVEVFFRQAFQKALPPIERFRLFLPMPHV